MSFEIVAAGIIVGLDNFAVAIALGAVGERRHALRIGVTFALFGGVAPAVGVFLGSELAELLAGLAGPAAAVVLGGLAVWMIRTALRSNPWETAAARFSSGGGLLALAAGMSADNLAVGFGLGLHGARSLPLAAVAAVSVFSLTQLGLRLGVSARERWERGAVLAAAALLIVLASAFLFS